MCCEELVKGKLNAQLQSKEQLRFEIVLDDSVQICIRCVVSSPETIEPNIFFICFIHIYYICTVVL